MSFRQDETKTGGNLRSISFDSEQLELSSKKDNKGRLIGSRCQSCGLYHAGKRLFCQRCSSSNLKEVELSRRGRLGNYTVVHVRPPGWKWHVPYVLAAVDMPEGIEIRAAMVECDLKAVQTGMEVEFVTEQVDKDADGNDIICYRWKPVK